MRSTTFRLNGQRGAMMIQVAISILMLMGFTVFVVDYGIVWVARGQAQNAADAGALSGTLARRYDDKAATPVSGATGVAWTAATQLANENLIWGQQGVAQTSWTCPTEWAGYRCTRVDVYMNGDTDSMDSPTLPVFFGPLLGVTSQGVKATATGVVASGGSVQCLKPWIVADRFPASGLADYVAPYYEGHTGYNVNTDVGLQLVLKEGEPGTLSSGWTGTLNLPDPPSGKGGPMYNNIAQCNQTVVGIATPEQACGTVDEPEGCVDVKTGVEIGPTRSGIKDLIAPDSTGYWDKPTSKPAGGCVAAGNCPGGVTPRIVPIAIFDPTVFDGSGCTGGGCITKVVNIIGFYLEGMCNDISAAGGLDAGNDCGKFPNKAVVGRISEYTALSFGTPVDDAAAFLQFVVLVR